MSNPYTPSTTSAAHPMTRRLKIRKVGVLSMAMLQGVMMAVLSFVGALIYALLGGVFLAAAASSGGIPSSPGAPSPGAMAGMGIGLMIGMVIIVPLLYGALGFIFGALGALVYNVVAGWTGGLEMEVLDRDDARPY